MWLILMMLVIAAPNRAEAERELPQPKGPAWKLHVIDGSAAGADGVKLADANGDGRLDIACGWEESGMVRGYFHPGHEKVRDAWPRLDVGKAPSVEDAVWADLDSDGRMDVVACSEGRHQQVTVFFGPEKRDGPWQGGTISAVKGQQWMFAEPLDIDGKHGVDLVVGSKNRGGSIGWIQSPGNPRELDKWRYHKLAPAGWIMSILLRDMDGDGDIDICYSDRRGRTRGVWWLQRPSNVSDPWKQHRIWTDKADILSMQFGDVDGDGLVDLTVAVEDHRVVWLRRLKPRDGQKAPAWQAITIPHTRTAGNTRSANPGDIDGDGDLDIAVTTWNSDGKHGVFWLENDGTPAQGDWPAHAISGTKLGIKYDHSELLDIDGDGDLDLLTCEERENRRGLGVIWYENPRRPKPSS